MGLIKKVTFVGKVLREVFNEISGIAKKKWNAATTIDIPVEDEVKTTESPAVSMSTQVEDGTTEVTTQCPACSPCPTTEPVECPTTSAPETCPPCPTVTMEQTTAAADPVTTTAAQTTDPQTTTAAQTTDPQTTTAAQTTDPQTTSAATTAAPLPCSLNPCGNGTCLDLYDGTYYCICYDGYAGTTCDQGLTPYCFIFTT